MLSCSLASTYTVQQLQLLCNILSCAVTSMKMVLSQLDYSILSCSLASICTLKFDHHHYEYHDDHYNDNYKLDNGIHHFIIRGLSPRVCVKPVCGVLDISTRFSIRVLHAKSIPFHTLVAALRATASASNVTLPRESSIRRRVGTFRETLRSIVPFLFDADT